MKTSDVLISDAEKSGNTLELCSNTALKVRYIKEITKRLELKNSFNIGAVVNRDKIESIQNFLSEERSKIHTVFQLREWSETDTKTDSFEATLKLLKKLLGNWCNTDLKPSDKKSKKKQKSYILGTRGDIDISKFFPNLK